MNTLFHFSRDDDTGWFSHRGDLEGESDREGGPRGGLRRRRHTGPMLVKLHTQSIGQGCWDVGIDLVREGVGPEAGQSETSVGEPTKPTGLSSGGRTST